MRRVFTVACPSVGFDGTALVYPVAISPAIALVVLPAIFPSCCVHFCPRAVGAFAFALWSPHAFALAFYNFSFLLAFSFSFRGLTACGDSLRLVGRLVPRVFSHQYRGPEEVVCSDLLECRNQWHTFMHFQAYFSPCLTLRHAQACQWDLVLWVVAEIRPFQPFVEGVQRRLVNVQVRML